MSLDTGAESQGAASQLLPLPPVPPKAAGPTAVDRKDGLSAFRWQWSPLPPQSKLLSLSPRTPTHLRLFLRCLPLCGGHRGAGSSPTGPPHFHEYRAKDLEVRRGQRDHLILQMGKLRPIEVIHLRTELTGPAHAPDSPRLSVSRVGHGSHSSTVPASRSRRSVEGLGGRQWLCRGHYVTTLSFSLPTVLSWPETTSFTVASSTRTPCPPRSAPGWSWRRT